MIGERGWRTMVNERPRSGGRPRATRYGFAATVAGAVVLVAVLVVAVSHKQAQFPTGRYCPSSGVVNKSLGTDVSPSTAVAESDLLGCFYREGSDTQAVAVTFAASAPGQKDPCRRRERFRLAGKEACNVTGARGTSRSGGSLLVEEMGLEEQFSTDQRSIAYGRLEALAVTVLRAPPPPVHDDGTG
jgi:hypothetical protein